CRSTTMFGQVLVEGRGDRQGTRNNRQGNNWRRRAPGGTYMRSTMAGGLALAVMLLGGCVIHDGDSIGFLAEENWGGPCTTWRECPTGAICDRDHVCRQGPTTCVSDYECGRGDKCVNERCVSQSGNCAMSS